jgi:hypothetical protein
MRFCSKAVIFASSGQFIDTADFLLVDVQDRDEREREGVEVGVGILVACVLGKDETLEVATTFILFVQTTVGPGFDDNLVVVRDIQLGNCLLKFRVGLADIDKNLELLTIKKSALICKCTITKLTESKQLDAPFQ